MESPVLDLKVTQELLNAIMTGLDEIPTKTGMPAKIEIMKQVEEFNKKAKEAEQAHHKHPEPEVEDFPQEGEYIPR